MVHEVGSFEAKTRLAELLRLAESGDEVIVLRRGQRIAVILSAARYTDLTNPKGPGGWWDSLKRYCDDERAAGHGISTEDFEAIMRESRAQRK